MKKIRGSVIGLIVVFALLGGVFWSMNQTSIKTPIPTQVEKLKTSVPKNVSTQPPSTIYGPPERVRVEFPSEKYPETAQHFKEAIDNGQPSVCTLDVKRVFENREIALGKVPVKQGTHRSIWPSATCAESREGVDIKYIDPEDDTGAGRWMDKKLWRYPDGTKIEFIFE
ncbi:nuclease [Paenibacillus polymyxa]|nr:nuclease [Paenibacillus polymyxa]